MKKAPIKPKARVVTGSEMKKTEIRVIRPRNMANTRMIVKPIVRFNVPNPAMIHPDPRELNPALL